MGRRLSRRQFCVVTGVGLVAGACGDGSGGGGAGLDRGVASDPRGTPDFADPTCPVDGKLNVGAAASFTVDSATSFNCAHLFVCRDASGLYALTAVCTHEGCDVGFAQGAGFACPCHGTTYDFNGAVTRLPATRPLVHYAVSLDGQGNAVVDLNTNVPPSTRLSV